MNWNFLIIHIFITLNRCDVQYASGYSTTWSNVNCVAGQTCTQTVSFPQQFSRVPQVSVNPCIILNYWNGNYIEVGFDFSITSITTSNFIVNLKAQVNTVKYYTFYWIAVDDKRIEILTNFNVANPQSTQLQHNNANANTGIIFFTSFYAKTQVDFTLSLGTITTSTVDVNIVHQNMKSLGYIVILGPAEFFDIEAQIIAAPKKETSISYNSTQQNLAFFMQYFSFIVNRDLLIEVMPTFQATYSYYKFCTWAGFASNFPTAAHQCATLKFDITTMKPILFHKLRISGLILLEQINTLDFSIPQVSKTYVQQTTNDLILVPINLQSLSFNFLIQCNQNYKITGQYYQCDSPCSNQYKKTIRYCYNPSIVLILDITNNQMFMQPHSKLKYIKLY